MDELGFGHSSSADVETGAPKEYTGSLHDQALSAAEHNDIDHLRDLISKDPSVVHARDSDQYTPLHRACYEGHLEAVKLLLDNGADHGSKTSWGWEPLHCAAKWCNHECAFALIAAGANVNATTNGGMTPLHLAANEKSGRKITELLLWQSTIDADIVSQGGDLPRELANRMGNFGSLFEMVEPSVNSLH